MTSPPFNNDDFEFVELLNRGVTDVSLAYMKLTGAVSFEFPDVELGPGEYAVIVSSRTAFGTRYSMAGMTVLGSFDGRLSIRPLGPIFPNIQLSYFFILGRGNQAEGDDWDAPEWRNHTFMASFEHKYLALTGQFVMGKGNQKGNFTDWATEVDPVTGEDVIVGIDEVYEYLGASGFLEVKLPQIWSTLIGRVDWFRSEDSGSTCSDEQCDTMRIIAGYAFHFHGMHKNFVMLDVDYVIPDRDITDVSDTWEVKLTLQVKL